MATSGRCIGCGAGLQAGGKKGRIVCPYCGTVNVLDRPPLLPDQIICVKCGNENPLGAEHCGECGANLYVTCPRCNTRNTADSVHCTQCGANLAEELRNFQIRQAHQRALLEQQQAMQAEAQARKKRHNRAVAIPVVIILFAVGIFVLISTTNYKRQEEQRMRELRATWTVEARAKSVAGTATAQYKYENFPYKWISSDGLLDVRISPRIENYDGDLLVYSYFTNNTGSRCAIPGTATYAVDEDGRVYANKYAWNTDLVEYVETGHRIDDASFLTPWLSANATKLTLVYPNICGYSNIRITVDLTASDITID